MENSNTQSQLMSILKSLDIPKTICLVMIAIVTLFLSFYNLGGYSFWRTDEVTHVQVMTEMVHDGHWLSPTVGGVGYFNKPPLKMWLSALIVKFFGENNFNYRFLDGVCGSAIILLTMLFAFELFASARVAILTSLCLLSSFSFFFLEHGSRFAVQDTAHLFLILMSLRFIWRALMILGGLPSLSSEPSPRSILKPLIIAGFFSGCAIMVKSFIGLFPYFVFIATAISDKKIATALLQKNSIKAVLISLFIALAIPAVYFIPHFLFSLSAFNVVVFDEIYNRVSEGIHNRENIAFYFQQIFFERNIIAPEALALSLLSIPLLRKSMAGLALRFCSIWGIATVLIFTAIPSRLPWYITPALPGLALLIGATLDTVLRVTPKVISVPIFLISIGSIALGLERNVQTLFTQSRIISADRISSAVREFEKNNGGSERLSAAVESGLALGRKEYLYYYFLKPESLDASEILKGIAEKKYQLLFVSDVLYRKIAEVNPPTSYIVLKPSLGRKRWMYILSYVPEFAPYCKKAMVGCIDGATTPGMLNTSQ